ncbi:MAG: lipopolysaccharide biosynthesis protein [Limibaculum sp.]
MVQHNNIIVCKRLVAFNSASSVAARFINLMVLLWMYQYLLKRVSAEEFAVYPVVTAIMVFAPLFFSFFSGGVSRYVIDAYAKGDFEEVSRTVSSILPMLVGSAAVFLAAGLLFSFNIEKVLNIAPQMVGDARIMMSLLIAGFALQMVCLPFGIGYQVRQRYVELNLLGILSNMLRIVLLLIFLLGIGPGVIWVVVATFISKTAHLAVLVTRSRRLVPELRFEWRLFEMGKARELMSFGVWTTLGQLGTVMYTNAATLVLNLYGSAVDVTSYHIGATFYRQLHSTIGMAALPLQPAITAMNALADRRRLAATVLRGGRYALWVSMIVAAPLALYADTFIGLYLGPKYSTAAMVIVLFMLIFPFREPTRLLPMTAMAMAQMRVFFLPAFLFQLFGLGLMLYFAARQDMGAVGVTLALTIITVASQLLYFWRLCLRLIGTAFPTFARDVLLRGLAPALAGLLVWGALKFTAPPEDWFRLGLYGALGALVYVAVLLGACLDDGERRDLLAGLARLGLASR